MSKVKRTSLFTKLDLDVAPILNREVKDRTLRKERAALKKTIQQAIVLAYGPKHPHLLAGVDLNSMFGRGKIPTGLLALVGPDPTDNTPNPQPPRETV